MTDTPSWPPAGCPPLTWPSLPAPSDPDQRARLHWYRAVVDAYSLLWAGDHIQARYNPVPSAALEALEQRLEHPLPEGLKRYYRELGAVRLSELLGSVQGQGQPIQPLTQLDPGIMQRLGQDEEHQVAQKLIVIGGLFEFGKLLGYRWDSGEVYLVQYHQAPMLRRLFSETTTLLDAIMIRCLAEIHLNEEGGEYVLAKQLGREVMMQWLY